MSYSVSVSYLSVPSGPIQRPNEGTRLSPHDFHVNGLSRPEVVCGQVNSAHVGDVTCRMSCGVVECLLDTHAAWRECVRPAADKHNPYFLLTAGALWLTLSHDTSVCSSRSCIVSRRLKISSNFLLGAVA